MQGTVWGGLYCTTMMNNLGEISYQDKNIYKYKGEVPIPTLQMVDDILGIQNVIPRWYIKIPTLIPL